MGTKNFKIVHYERPDRLLGKAFSPPVFEYMIAPICAQCGLAVDHFKMAEDLKNKRFVVTIQCHGEEDVGYLSVKIFESLSKDFTQEMGLIFPTARAHPENNRIEVFVKDFDWSKVIAMSGTV